MISLRAALQGYLLMLFIGAALAAGIIGITPASAPGIARLLCALAFFVLVGWWSGLGRAIYRDAGGH